MSSRRVAIIPHTHWDREWYSPFQTFRMDLVDTLDALLPLLEEDPSYARFMLDGQMAVVDDYLEVRPEAETRIRNLAAAGRLTMGPWYILMDEFLVSGETIIRNLQLGIQRGAGFGGVMDVGYLPDMFGHIAQMPQILTSAGFKDTVIWRGVPSAITKTGKQQRRVTPLSLRLESFASVPSWYRSASVRATLSAQRFSLMWTHRSSSHTIVSRSTRRITPSFRATNLFGALPLRSLLMRLCQRRWQ